MFISQPEAQPQPEDLEPYIPKPQHPQDVKLHAEILSDLLPESLYRTNSYT